MLYRIDYPLRINRVPAGAEVKKPTLEQKKAILRTKAEKDCREAIKMWISEMNEQMMKLAGTGDRFAYSPVKFFPMVCYHENIWPAECTMKCIADYMKFNQQNNTWEKINNRMFVFYFRNGQIYKVTK